MAYFFYRQHPERYLDNKTRLIKTSTGKAYLVTTNELTWHCYDHYTTEPGFCYTPDKIIEYALADDFVDASITSFSERFTAALLYLDELDYGKALKNQRDNHCIN